MQDEEVIQRFSPHASGENVHRQHWPGARSIRRSQHIDATCGRHTCEMRTEFPVMIPNQVCGCLSIRSRLPQLLCYPKIGRGTGHIHMDPPSATSARVLMKKAKSGRKKRSGTCKKSQAHTSCAGYLDHPYRKMDSLETLMEDTCLFLEDRYSLVEKFNSHPVCLSSLDKLSLSPRLYSSRGNSLKEMK